MARQTSRNTVLKARRLRKEMSLPEVLLWQQLRGSEPRIRRQHPAGPYVLDFYCPAAKLGIEVDGVAHEMGDRPQRDEVRAAFFEARGVGLIRIPAAEVLASPVEIAEAVLAVCRDKTG
jgi:very-short-patch-repair endonuclease